MKSNKNSLKLSNIKLIITLLKPNYKDYKTIHKPLKMQRKT